MFETVVDYCNYIVSYFESHNNEVFEYNVDLVISDLKFYIDRYNTQMSLSEEQRVDEVVDESLKHFCDLFWVLNSMGLTIEYLISKEEKNNLIEEVKKEVGINTKMFDYLMDYFEILDDNFKLCSREIIYKYGNDSDLRKMKESLNKYKIFMNKSDNNNNVLNNIIDIKYGEFIDNDIVSISNDEEIEIAKSIAHKFK